jgi:AraC-like DNA-binding protein
VDVLADILAVTRLGAPVVAQAELVPPWGLEIDPAAEAAVHSVQRGSCWLHTHRQRRPLHLGAGDVVLIRAGVAHSISDDPRTRPLPYAEALAAMPRRLASLPASRAHETTIVLCAKYLFQRTGSHPLLLLLPETIHIPAKDLEHQGQLQLVLQLLRREANEAGSGSELVIPRLVDSLLVFVLRAWLDAQPINAGGWFGALREPAIARALSLIHGAPEAAWNVELLARRVGQSRATFARRFADLVGEPPIAYLTRWRMCLAARLLSQSNVSLDEIATRVGYETAAAFSKAFRRSHRTAPGRFRQRMRAA